MAHPRRGSRRFGPPLSTPKINRAELSRRLGLDLSKRPVGVVIHHNITNEISQSARQMKVTLEGVAASGLTAAIIYPNSDVGSQEMIGQIEQFQNRVPNFRAYRNLPRLEFVNLLRHADVMVGNSTCGITEAPLLGLPGAVNVAGARLAVNWETMSFLWHMIARKSLTPFITSCPILRSAENWLANEVPTVRVRQDSV